MSDATRTTARGRISRKSRHAAAWAVPLLGAAAVLGATATPRSADRPALVVLFTVDQMRPDYVDRFASDLTGGFGRLRRDGTFFTAARHDHAMTSTAPGHATLWSGRFPTHTGILSNNLGVPDPGFPLIGAEATGASPRRFLGTALYDWIRAADPGSLMLSVSRKDRGAILPVGAAQAQVFWWANPGKFTTSRFYADTLPTWVQGWNADFAKTDWSGRVWTPLLADSAYHEVDDEPYEGTASGYEPAFPHPLPSVRRLVDFPWMDSLTLDVALHGERALGLGRGDDTDVLAVSLSTLDAVGHAYGPDSREVHDHFVRLDRWLGAFMGQLERDLPGRSVLFVLSADHGIPSMPEATGKGGRLELGPTLDSVVGPVREQHPREIQVSLQDGLAVADTAAIRAVGVNVRALAAALVAAYERLPGVARAWTPWTLGAAAANDAAAGRWRRSIPASYGWLVAVDPAEGWMLGRSGLAEHGTTVEDDARVPIFFLGLGVRAQRVARPVRTVDIAPTIAEMLGIRPTEAVDGVPMSEVLAPN